MSERKNTPPLLVLEGTCAAGCSTLVDIFSSNKHPHVVVAPEGGRKYFEEHDVPLHERYLYKTQAGIQQYAIASISSAMQQASEIEGGVVLADSSPLAAAAYAHLNSTELAQQLFDNIQTWLHAVSCFLLVNPDDVPYELDPTDPIRTETPEQRLAVHQSLKRLIHQTGRPQTLIHGSVDDRVAQIEAVVESFRT